MNDENNVEMFTSSVRGGKAFAAEQKIRELKTRVWKLKISSAKTVQNSTLNTNLMKSCEMWSVSRGNRKTILGR